MALVGGNLSERHAGARCIERMNDGARFRARKQPVAGERDNAKPRRRAAKGIRHRAIVIALYVYALLQIVFVEPLIGSPDENDRYLAVVTVAFILKVLLYWEFLRVIRSGTLIYYMYAYRKLLDEDDERRNNFLAMLRKHGPRKPKSRPVPLLPNAYPRLPMRRRC